MENKRLIRMSTRRGIIADIHRDLTPDADERLGTFMKLHLHL